ncbi:MAG: ferritin family protein [Bacillota bacterium]|nr:ferritin family protein [Bacillota bacterium]
MSGNTFSQLEMLRIAVLMEEEGRDFYTNCAELASGKVKNFFVTASGQEFLHGVKFQDLYNELLEKETEPVEYLFDEDITTLLRALIENSVFDRKDKASEIIKDLKSAAEYALKSEKLTVEVYENLFENTKNPEIKAILNTILDEEREHVEYFSRLLEEID